MLVAAMIVFGAVGFLIWKRGPRRPQGPGFNFVYVNLDGSVQELYFGGLIAGHTIFTLSDR